MAASAGDDSQRAALQTLNALHVGAAALLKEYLEFLGDAKPLSSACSDLGSHVGQWVMLLRDISGIQGTAEPVVMNAAWKTIVLLLRTHRDTIPATFSAQPLVDSTFAELSRNAQLVLSATGSSAEVGLAFLYTRRRRNKKKKKN